MAAPKVKPLLKYPGGKWALASWIVRYLPETPHYVEPFCGSAAVYFNLPWRPRHAVLNDLSGDIVNLFRVIRERGDELAALIEMTPWAREEYERSYEVTEEPVERARRFLVRTWQGHGSKLNTSTGWTHCGVSTPYTLSHEQFYRITPRIVEAAKMLRTAEIEHKPAADVVRRYHDQSVGIYADPPYPYSTRSGGIYQHEMTDADHIALLDTLDAHPGPVALSGYRCSLYDDRLTAWRRVETQAQDMRANSRTECLWLNKTLQERLSLGPLFAGLEPAA